jgi:hypothetical protein
MKRNQRLRLSGCQNELYFETLGRIHVHHRTQVAAPQTLFRKVTSENNGVEQVEHELARERSNEVREISPMGDEPDRHDGSLAT